MVSEQKAMSELQPYIADMETCITAGLRRYATDHKQLRHGYSRRSESSLINDCMLNEVRRVFSSKPGVNVLVKRNSAMLNIGGKYLLRFKKLDHRRGASYIRTGVAVRFAAQLTLVDGAKTTNLFVGYVRDDGELLKSTAWIMCPAGDRIAWRNSITPPTPAAIPLRPATSRDEKKPRRRVTGKKKLNDTNDQNGT